MREVRTIISAIDPVRMAGEHTVLLKVWFAELDEPVLFNASPLDCEPHGRELWIRAMAGEYGPVLITEKQGLIL